MKISCIVIGMAIVAVTLAGPGSSAGLDQAGPPGMDPPDAPPGIPLVRTITELRNLTGSPGLQAVQVLGYHQPGDGGGGLFHWRSGAVPGKYADDSGITIVPVGGDGSGAWIRPHADTLPLTWWGVSAETSAADNKAAIDAAWAILRDAGGRIIIPPSRLPVLFNRSDLPPTTARITIEGHGEYGTRIQPAQEDAGDPGSFMWTIGAEGTTSFVTLQDFMIQGDKMNRTNSGGIRILQTNRLVVNRVSVRHLKGTAVETQGAHNATIDARTYACGSWNHRRPAVWFRPAAGTGRVCNDVVISGHSEQDEYGWAFHDCPNLRSAGTVKVHGRSDASAKRGFEIMNCRLFNVDLFLTQGFGGDGFIYIGDNLGVARPLNYLATAMSGSISQGLMKISTLSNVTNNDKENINSMLLVDLGAGGSYASLCGSLHNFDGVAGANPYKIIRLTNVASSSPRVDLSNLHVLGGDETHWLDDLRSLSNNLHLPAVGRRQGIIAGLRELFMPQRASDRYAGTITALSFPSHSHGPAARGLNLSFGSGAQSDVQLGMNSLSYSFRGSFDRTETLVPGNLLPAFVDASGASGHAAIRRITIGVIGGDESWSDTQNWKLTLAGERVLDRYYLARDKTYAFDGAGFPRSVISVDGEHTFDFWEGENDSPILLAPSTPLRLQLSRTGPSTDREITNLSISVWYELLR